MASVDILTGLLETGTFLRPSAAEPSFRDLAAAFVLASGGRAERTAGATQFENLIGGAEHLVFVLVDGLEARLLGRLPEGSYLRSHVRMEYRTVFPSTTSAVLTTLYTTRWPARHAIASWWVYLDSFGLSIVPLPFKETYTEKPLSDFGVAPGDVFTAPSAWGTITRDTATVICRGITDSVYTNYGSAGTRTIGYDGMGDTFAATRRRLALADGPTFTYVYLPQVDSVCHEKGTTHPDTLEAMTVIDAQVASLAADAPRGTRIAVTADHGELDTPAENRFVVDPGDELLTRLVAPPTGEPAMPVFHVKSGGEAAFRNEFEKRFGKCFALLTPEEMDELRLFGPMRISPLLRRRLGTFAAVAVEPAAFYYRPALARHRPFEAVHARLTLDEMLVPLVVA